MTQTYFQRQIELLRRSYAEKLPARVAEIIELWSQALAQTDNPARFDPVRMAAHSMSGSAATYGLPLVIYPARDLAGLLETLIEESLAIDDSTVEQVESLLAELSAGAARSGQRYAREAPTPGEDSTPATTRDRDLRTVCLLQPEDPTREIAIRLGRHGYSVRVFSRWAALVEAVAESGPLAVVIDIVSPEGTPISDDLVSELRHAASAPFPILFFADRADVETRLLAARLGGAGFCAGPDPAAALAEALGKILHSRVAGPLRVAIVEADTDSYEAIDFSLKSAGMVTELIEDPTAVVDSVARFTPDVVLLAADLPGFNGFHLGTVIRHQPKLAAIPILIMTEKTEVKSDLCRTQLGADGVLTKPLDGAELICVVSSWAERYRSLRGAMTRDVATGLLNDGAMQEQLSLAVALAEREETSLALALVDIDGLDQINDTHGYSMGDRIVSGLAKHLKAHARPTDVVGRSTGARFAMILPHSEGAEACQLLEAIRSGFAKMTHADGGPSPAVSVSIGIAVYPHYHDVLTLREAADRALAEARTQAGDRIVQRSQRGEKGHRVLVIDDDTAITDLMVMALEHHGYEAISARDGVGGFDLAQREKPDLILTDLLLPGMNGFDLCKKIKESKGLAQVPVVMMTDVYKKYRYKIEAKRCGADDFIEKPLDVAKVLSSIDRVLAKNDASASDDSAVEAAPS